MSSTKSVRSLLSDSRKSGPAIVYKTLPDKSRIITEVREARPPHSAPRLSREEVICILVQTGEMPEHFHAPGNCGVQANDNVGVGVKGPPRHSITYEDHVVPGAYVTPPLHGDA